MNELKAQACCPAAAAMQQVQHAAGTGGAAEAARAPPEARAMLCSRSRQVWRLKSGGKKAGTCTGSGGSSRSSAGQMGDLPAVESHQKASLVLSLLQTCTAEQTGSYAGMLHATAMKAAAGAAGMAHIGGLLIICVCLPL